MPIYAEPDHLMDGWLAEQPDEDHARLLLRFASDLVRDATKCDLYETEPNGLPVDLDILEAMRDATCAHTAMWIRAGIDPAAGAVGRPAAIAAQSADGGSVTYGETVTGAEIQASLQRLSGAALRILRNAGLASTRPRT